MSARPTFRETPTVRELLTRSTWDELDRIAGRYGVQFAGRRRPLAVERLALVLERPDQLRAAYKILPEPARAVLGLLLLMGSSEDERALLSARDRLVAVRPELEPLLTRVHIPNEVQSLMSLGLCFRDRRRLVVPLEVLNALSCAIAPSTTGTAPHEQPHEYAALHYLLTALVAAIEQARPVAITPYRVSTERTAAYQPLLLTHEAANDLSRQLKVPVPDLTLLLSLLHTLGGLGIARGRWQVQPEWHALLAYAPRELLLALLDAWQRSRTFSDLGATREFVWMCGPDVDGATVVGQHEAKLRSIIWRWLLWCDQESVDLALFAQTLVALQPALFHVAQESASWIGRIGTGRNLPIDEAMLPDVALAVVQQVAHQLGRLGLVVTDGASCALTPTARWLYQGDSLTTEQPPVQSIDTYALLVHPLAVDAALLRLIRLAGQLMPPQGAYARYVLSADGMARLLQEDVPIMAFEQALLQSGAQLTPAFQAQLELWAERAGRLRLHRPLTMIITAEDTPIAQVLAAAGIANAAEVLGPGCALIEPEYAEPAVEQLRMRGFWPLVVGDAAPAETLRD
jgi:hypothetical protein